MNKYALFLCGDEEPTMIYNTKEEAEEAMALLSECHWMDKRVEVVHDE